MVTINFLVGKKTYILAIANAIYALSAWYTGHIDLNAMILLILGSGAVSALRSAISSK